MAPNASPFVNLFANSHAVGVHKNIICHQFHNNGSALFHNRLQSIRESFAAVNGHFLKENLLESVGRFSPSAGDCSADERLRLNDARALTAARLELMRKALMKRTVREKLEAWQRKKDEASSRIGRFLDVPKCRREEILKKENYERAYRGEIEKQSTAAFDYRRRSREILFKAALARAALIVSTVNGRLDGDPRLTSGVGEKRVIAYRSMVAKLDALKNAVLNDDAPLAAAKSLLEDLTLYQNNVVTPIQAELEARVACNDDNNNDIVKRKYVLNKFSVNVPNESLVKHVRRQYVALVKNNKLLLDNLTDVKDVPFASDPTVKQFRQNVIRVVNTLVNTISSTSAAHLTDKHDKLNALLSGKLVCVANTQVMVGRHKEAMAFCMETLSKKIVSYAEEVVCVNARAAHEIAAVIAKLWSVHQQFGKVLFAEIKRKCPLLTPFCYPSAKSLTDQDLDRRSFGYKIDSSGNIESDVKFLRRMTGIVRLYAALMVATAKHDLPVVGLSQAWIFVAGTLNQNPVADITATMLVEFLNVVGFEMHRAYGKQFVKLLQYIDTYYLKKIILVTPAEHGGPITRLKSFVSKCLHCGLLEEPEGILSPDFW